MDGTPAPTEDGSTQNVLGETHETRSSSPPNPGDTARGPNCISCSRSNRICDGRSPCFSCIRNSSLCSNQTQSDPPAVRKAQLIQYNVVFGDTRSTSRDSEESPAPSEQGSVFSDTGPSGSAELDDANTNTEKSVESSGLIAFRPLQSLQRGKNAAFDGQIQKSSRVDIHTHDAPDSETTADERDPQLDDESDASESSVNSIHPIDIEPEIDAFTTLAIALRQQLHAFEERAVQADLRQATVDMRKTSAAQIDSALPDPFQDLTQQRRADAHVLPLVHERGTGLGQLEKAHERSQNRKLMIIRAPEQYFSTGGPVLPKYKAIGRVATSFLAPNYRTAKYRPYDAEDEIQDPEATQKYAELEQRFNNNYEALTAQRNCQELIWLWRPWAEELLSRLQIQKSDVLYFFTQDHFDPSRECDFEWHPASKKAWREEQMRRCRTCELADPEGRRTHFSETFNSLPVPDDRALAYAGMAAHVFHEVAGLSLWHIALGGLLEPRYEDPQAVTKESCHLCVICFRYQCPDHGSYEEPRDEYNGVKDSEDLKAFINDEEKDHNVRKFMSLPPRKRETEPTHICGVFCVDPTLTLQQIVGQQADGSIDGQSRPIPQRRHILRDNELCSSSCFWSVRNRRNIKIADVKFQPFLSQSQKVLVEKLTQFYLHNKRGPCLVSRVVKDVSCLMVFHHMIFQIFEKPHIDAEIEPASNGGPSKHAQGGIRKKKKPVVTIDTSMSPELDGRPPFFPCTHEGPCHNNPACTCAKTKVHCEQFCGCDESCKRRFRGCSCTGRGNKICFKDNRCECWKLNRECDPYLCGKCGVIDVLESSNKYRDDVRRGRCRNNRLQLGLPAATTKAPSQVQGYGLYSRVEIQSGEFIGEYTGEVISISEGDRRGAMYHVLNQEYLFVINKGQEIDASNNGNKMRFMNNSQREEIINVEPKKLFCSGLVRVGLFARRDIKAGEELLYNYNYPPSVVKNFWEPGERPTNARGLIPVISERVARTTGANLLTEENGSEDREERSQSPLISRHPKRKRPLDESPAVSSQAEGSDFDKIDSKLPEIDDSEDLDYETNDHVSDDDGEDDGEDDADLDDPPDMVRRRRPSTRRRTIGGRPARGGRSTATNGKGSRTVQLRGGSATTVQRGRTKARLGRDDTTRKKTGANDKRYGGKAQQQAWRTRRLNESQSQDNSSSEMLSRAS